MKELESVICLNGWWDFCPAGTPEIEASVPMSGWAEAKYLVPSLVDKSLGGVRKKGEIYYRAHLNEDPTPFCDGEHEFLFDNHDYPVEWLATLSGWARRTLTVNALAIGKRRFLKLDAVAGRSEVWINGVKIAIHEDAFLPNEIDVTDLLKEGDNELAVLVRDYERHKGEIGPIKTMTPSGNMMSAHFRGIWQDVWLIERGEVYVSNTTIRTSFREKTLTVLSEISNSSDSAVEVVLKSDVSEWMKGSDAFEGAVAIEIPDQTLTVAAGTTACIEVTVPWAEPKLWQPESPNLYWLRSSVEKDSNELDRIAERFGFREVWIEGPNFILNGFPVHFFSDWGHKLNQLHHTEAWNRCWFDMMKAENFNHSRLHTHPHPELIMDLADEEGIMITGETAIHGSGGEQAADEDRYWENARDHVRAYIRRDKNHPSLLLWSVENEMRWNQDATDKTKTNLPELYQLFRELDPTREAYHEGDSSLWNENEQAIMSRHYGKECGGYEWWDKKRPLHAGEMSSYHYMGPNTNFHTANGAGDELWADYFKVVEAGAYETKWIIEAGRTQGTAAFGPWNISCLCNLRMTPERVELDYDDWTTPGVKPQYINAHSAEYEFWKESGPRYTPCGESNTIQASCFRPFALIDLSHRRSYFGGKVTERTLYLVNDSTSDQTGTISVRVEGADGQSIISECISASVRRGHIFEHALSLEFPEVSAVSEVSYKVSFTNDAGEQLDLIDQTWKLCPQVPECLADRSTKVVVVGKGQSLAWLDAMAFSYDQLEAFEAPVPEGTELFILERDTVAPGSLQNQWVESFVQTGGRVLVLEQKNSLFPSVVLESKPQLHGYPRAYEHPLLEGFAQQDFEFWGEDPYASMSSDSHIAHRLYQKGESCLLQPVVDAGEGGFGFKLPEWIALGELQLGKGKLLASQFRFSDKASTIPQAGRIFAAMLDYLLTDVVAASPSFVEAEASDSDALEQALATANAGGNAYVRLRDSAGAAAVGQLLGRSLEAFEELRYHAVRKAEVAELNGISNVDVSGIDGMSYCFSEKSCALASIAIEPVEGLEAILVTPTRAYLEEEHVHGQRVEALRTHGASRFLFAEAPKERVMLGRIKHGDGWVYVDTFGKMRIPAQSFAETGLSFGGDGDLSEQPHTRLVRYESMLRRNLGATLEVNALTGESVPKSVEFSQGFPEQVCIQSVATREMRDSMISNTSIPAERMAPTSMFRLGGWSNENEASGTWKAVEGDETAIFTCMYSPRVRKIVMEDSGIPNPESLTFLNIAAPSGDVELVMNGASLGTKKIQGGKATFSDIELLQFFNQVLILWKGARPGDQLKFQFRDIMQNPETDIFFLEAIDDLSNWHQAEF